MVPPSLFEISAKAEIGLCHEFFGYKNIRLGKFLSYTLKVCTNTYFNCLNTTYKYILP